MNKSSFIELSRSALTNNLKLIQGILGPDCAFISVVKGNAYGHGIDSFVPLAAQCGVRNFAVFSAQEARQIYETGATFDRLIIMGYIHPEDMLWVIDHGIELFVFDYTRLENAIQLAKSLGKKAKVHLELETGLNRTGFEKKDWLNLVKRVKTEKDILEISGICTHLAGAEDISNYLRITQQIKVFQNALNYMRKHEVPFKGAHAACSAALISYPKTKLDMARIGILQYGFWPSREVKMAYFTQMKDNIDPLKRVISWKSSVMDLKEISAGEFIGYGRSYLSESDMRIAIIPVGYSNGFSRALSNLGKVLIKGVRVSVIGTVNMNMIAIDITHVPTVEIGDEVVLIGVQGTNDISVASFSDLSNLLNYELLTRLPASIPRTIVD